MTSLMSYALTSEEKFHTDPLLGLKGLNATLSNCGTSQKGEKDSADLKALGNQCRHSNPQRAGHHVVFNARCYI